MGQTIVARTLQANLFFDGQDPQPGQRIYLDLGRFRVYGIVASMTKGNELRLELTDVALVANSNPIF